MATKTFKVALSLDNPRLIQSGIDVRSFDKQSIKIAIELTKNSQAYQIPTGATIRISLLKLARQEQKIIVDVPNTNRDSIDWIVPDYLDGYQGTVRVGVYLVSGTENVDLGYFTILSNVSDIDKMADEFTDNVFQGWEQIEADLNELNLTIAQTKLDLAEDLTQIDNTIANINTLASDFTADVATKQADVTSKYNAFDTDITEANQTIDDILALQPQFQSVIDETTGKDVISAPEIILARGGAQTLGERLDSEKAEVSAQLAQTKNQIYSKDTKKIKPMVTFYLDDGHANDYDVVLPKASSLNIPLTISLHNSGNLINRPDDLKELVNTHGWEVHAHTVDNVDLRTLTLEEQKQTMRENKEFLENTFGFDVRGVCYPMGHSNSDTYVAAREYFDVGLESYYTRVPENLPPIKTYGLQRVALIADIETLKQTIDNIKEKGEGWIVFYSHSALYNQAGSEKETLFALMDYAVASGVDVVTVGEAMELYQNTLDIGDKVYSDKVAKIGSDGNVDFTDIPFVVDNDGYETINEKKGIDFLPNKITISHFNGTNQSNIPFDNGRGTLYTDRLNEASIYVGANAVQTFSSHLGNSYVRKYGDGVWSEWTSTSGFNTARITGNLEDKPITEYPENKVTAVSYVGAENTGISVGSGIGTVITMRLLGSVGTLSRQFFYPINESSYYTRRWLGSNQWDRWERVSTNIIRRVIHDYGTLGADETKVFSFDIDGVSVNDSVNVNFNYGLINGVIYYPFIEGNNAVKIKLINVTSSSKLVGSRGTVINVTKTGM